MMMTMPNSASEKRDLHVGGLGASAPVGLSTKLGPWEDEAMESPQRLLRRLRDAGRSANRLLADNPWAAVGLVACLGLAAGYLLSRRS